MKNQLNQHACACCPKPIGQGFVMCGRHWSMLSPGLQNKLYRTWGEFQRAGEPVATRLAFKAYRETYDEAAAAVQLEEAKTGAAA